MTTSTPRINQPDVVQGQGQMKSRFMEGEEIRRVDAMKGQ